MSGGSTTQGAVYSPLPQTISDTDSSEEELNSVLHSSNSYAVNRKIALPGKDFVKNGQKMGEYRQLGNDGETDMSVNGVPNQESMVADDIMIVKSEQPVCHGFSDMSLLRKFFFLFSIAMCGITVMVFLWVLPCDWATCPTTDSFKAKSRSWERTLVGLELKGAISIVPGILGKSHNLIFLLRGDVGNPNGPNNSGENGVESYPVEGGGIISLIGSTGVVAWWKKMPSLPRDIDCSVLDVDNNGVDDCIVLGGNGLLVAIDPVSGGQWWNMRSRSSRDMDQPTDLDFPLVIPDLNDDGINDLLTACSLSQQRNSLIIISGYSGIILGSNVQIRTCFKLHILSVENFTVSYICQQGDKEAVREVGLIDLYFQATNKPFFNTEKLMGAPIHQHKNYAARSLTFSVGERSLILENIGQCPAHCSVVVNVTDKRPGQGGQLVWNYTAENTYGMVPVTMVFGNQSGLVSGFVLKFWQWGAREEVEGGRNGTHLVIHRLSERVVLITFNSTDMHIVNASQSDITQLCSHLTSYEEDLDCQPNLSFQEQSLLIGDLDQDNSQELISFLSTYVLRKQNASSFWQLESKVRVIRLEAELPKLYEAVTKVV